MNTSIVYRTPDGRIFIQRNDGSFHVVRLDGGTETRWVLPTSAVALVSADSSIWDAA